ncbi:MAG: HAD family hydrolase [Acidimicrobiaceae bacterium]|nr:HAD family hydrolase [Acidimicrobiaceae bacterium]
MTADEHPLTVAFDADDTLWHNEDLFQDVQREYEELLSPWADAGVVGDRLHEVQMANLPRFGYGVKSFTLSMIEAAVRITGGEIDADRITAVIGYGKRLLDRPIELIDGVEEVLDALGHHRLMVITKGDVHDQLAKVAASGLAERFWRVEVVADKDAAVYGDLLERHGIDPARFVMVGNSLRSDVLPVLELGATAVHIPYHVTWRHEDDHDGHHVEVPTLEALRDLPQLLRGWDGDGGLAPGMAGPAGIGGRYGAHPA